MSRSNPTDNAPHPCTRWIEWDGSNSGFRYYDKEQKKNILLDDGFTFILLDQLSTIKGWHDASDSGIFANEVRDIKQDVLVVKAFKGGLLGSGPYQQIRDRVIAQGGHFTANLYVAIKTDDGGLAIAAVQFKGAALSAWLEFSKKNREDVYKKAVRCKGFEEGKKGKIVFRTPIFYLADLSADTNAKAIDCDHRLQEYLKSYFSRPRAEQTEKPPADMPQDEGLDQQTSDAGGRSAMNDLDDDDIPF